MSTDTHYQKLLSDNWTLLTTIESAAPDQLPLMASVMNNIFELGRIFELDPVIRWAQDTIQHLYDSTALFERHAGLVWFYATLLFGSLTDIYEHEDGTGWAEACRKRSALAFLLTIYEENTLPDYLEAGWDLDKLDARIRHCGKHNSTLQEDEIPEGIPEEHWWWWIQQK